MANREIGTGSSIGARLLHDSLKQAKRLAGITAVGKYTTTTTTTTA